MVSNSNISLTFTSLFILLAITQTNAQTGSNRVLNLTTILQKHDQFTTFIRLLQITQLGNQLQNQLDNNPTKGFTVFAPTDDAFHSLEPGTLNGLMVNELTQLVLYHIVPKFYTQANLGSVSNPVRTQAIDQYGAVLGFYIIGEGKRLRVLAGSVEARIRNPLTKTFPLAIYQVDKVLLPVDLFESIDSPAAPRRSPAYTGVSPVVVNVAPVFAPVPLKGAPASTPVGSPEVSEGAPTAETGAVPFGKSELEVGSEPSGQPAAAISGASYKNGGWNNSSSI
ncbi:Fasciclin-like arabinogalactan protein 9 [Linum perenne]